MQLKTARSGNSFFGIITVGIILVLMGVPFVGMTVMTAMMLAPNSRAGLSLALATLFVVFLISDFTGALIAATGAGFLTAMIKSRQRFRISVAAASAATALASVFGTILLPEQSLLSGDNIEALMQIYASEGMNTAKTLAMMEILMYILPSLLALWAAGGVIVSAIAIGQINRRRRVELNLPASTTFRLGLAPAWILIAALAVNLTGSNLSPFLQRASVNVSIFMILPYCAVGTAVARRLFSMYPQLLLLAVFAGVIFPPFAVAVLMITGILDTWFDFRERLNRVDERKNAE